MSMSRVWQRMCVPREPMLREGGAHSLHLRSGLRAIDSEYDKSFHLLKTNASPVDDSA